MTTYNSRRYALINRWDSSHLQRIDRLASIEPGAKVLEVGCGQGHLVSALAARGVDIIGIDANPMAEEVATSGLVRHMQAESLDFDDATFDYIVSVHAIEHIPQLDDALAEMSRVLKPEGQAVFVYPAEPIMGLYAIPTAVILHRNPLKAREVHCQKLWPAKLNRMVEPLGWEMLASEFSLLKTPQFATAFAKSA